MKISIITICLNDLQGLKKTRDSILCQTWKDWEWIVIDGGSSDGTKEFLQDHQEEMSYWCSEKDKGVYDAQNKGAQKATGNYCIFMNANDKFHDEHVLEIMVNSHPTADELFQAIRPKMPTISLATVYGRCGVWQLDTGI